MPSLDEWERALTIPRNVTVCSTAELVTAVNSATGSKTFTGIPKTAVVIPEFFTEKTISITGGELLNSIGRITTPRIENLVDVCSTWARLRYLWAFKPDPRTSNLALSAEARRIDFHQKSLLSDEIGVGMADLILERYFGAGSPYDVSFVLDSEDEIIPGITQKHRTSPDYIFQKPGNEYIVVECKGSQVGYSSAVRQLRRGLEQVISLEFSSGPTPVTLVICTCLSGSKTVVYLVDPPSSEKPSGKYRVEKEREFQDVAQRAKLANLLRYVGANGRAREIEPRRKKQRRDGPPRWEEQMRYEPPKRERIESLGAEFVGVEQEITLVGQAGRVRAFQGIPATLYQAITQNDSRAVDRETRTFYEKARRVSSEKRREIDRQGGEEQAYGTYFYDATPARLNAEIYSLDGTLLRLEIGQ